MIVALIIRAWASSREFRLHPGDATTSSKQRFPFLSLTLVAFMAKEIRDLKKTADVA